MDKFPDELKTGKEFDNVLREYGYIGKYVYKDCTYLKNDLQQGILQHIALEGNIAYKGDSLAIMFKVEHA